MAKTSEVSRPAMGEATEVDGAMMTDATEIIFMALSLTHHVAVWMKVTMAAVMMPTTPAFAAAVTLARVEFKVDNVVARTVPAIVVPSVCLAVPGKFLVIYGAGISNLQPRPAIAFGN